MELVDMRDLGSRAATRTGSSPLRRTSSEISLTAPFPAPKGRKAPQDGKFLRFQPRLASLDSRLIFTGDEGREMRASINTRTAISGSSGCSTWKYSVFWISGNRVFSCFWAKSLLSSLLLRVFCIDFQRSVRMLGWIESALFSFTAEELFAAVSR